MTHLLRTSLIVIGLAATQAAAQLSQEEEISAALSRGDYATALPLIRPLADQGDPRAQFNLGVSYEHGWGVAEDRAEAARWYRLAAEQGYSLAQHNLGLLYERGSGVPRDFAEALKWQRLAAERDNAFAQHSLGMLYQNGQGVPQDNVRAHMWFNLAAAKGHEPAVRNRDALTATMSREQVAEAQKLARQWKPAASVAPNSR